MVNFELWYLMNEESLQNSDLKQSLRRAWGKGWNNGYRVGKEDSERYHFAQKNISAREEALIRVAQEAVNILKEVQVRLGTVKTLQEKED